MLLIYLLLSQSQAEEQETEKVLPVTKRQFLYESKCSKCHTLGRVFADPKTPDEWRACVDRMREKSPLWITPEEGEQIVGEIVNTREDVVGSFPHKKRYDDAKLLFIDRCTECHSPDRIVLARKTRNDWKKTVLRMQKKSPSSFLDEDIPILTDYLAERGGLIRDDHAAEIMVTKCLVCHDAARILLERKSRTDWEKTVSDMQDYARKTFLKDWFLSNEFTIIVDLLEKTQGIESGGY
ncbi:MAG: hypothetical protein SCALA701_18280 [Candidatus Scalindua sp.]|nr:MAG: hypothetical protein SCALA701_18280 [Candidatus Scalindua sp.]